MSHEAAGEQPWGAQLGIPRADLDWNAGSLISWLCVFGKATYSLYNWLVPKIGIIIESTTYRFRMNEMTQTRVWLQESLHSGSNIAWGLLFLRGQGRLYQQGGVGSDFRLGRKQQEGNGREVGDGE